MSGSKGSFWVGEGLEQLSARLGYGLVSCSGVCASSSDVVRGPSGVFFFRGGCSGGPGRGQERRMPSGVSRERQLSLAGWSNIGHGQGISLIKDADQLVAASVLTSVSAGDVAHAVRTLRLSSLLRVC